MNVTIVGIAGPHTSERLNMAWFCTTTHTQIGGLGYLSATNGRLFSRTVKVCALSAPHAHSTRGYRNALEVVSVSLNLSRGRTIAGHHKLWTIQARVLLRKQRLSFTFSIAFREEFTVWFDSGIEMGKCCWSGYDMQTI